MRFKCHWEEIKTIVWIVEWKLKLLNRLCLKSALILQGLEASSSPLTVTPMRATPSPILTEPKAVNGMMSSKGDKGRFIMKCYIFIIICIVFDSLTLNREAFSWKCT